MGQLILNALLKELEKNPKAVLTLLTSLIALLEEHPELLTALIGALQKKTP